MKSAAAFRRAIFLKTRGLKAVLIDLDGTLAQSLPFLKQSYFDFLFQHGCQGSDEEFQELSGPSLSQIIGILKDRHCLDSLTEELYENYLAHLTRHYSLSVTPFPGAASLLDFLSRQGLRLSLVTSAPRSLAAAFLVRHAFDSFFEEIVSGEDVATSKPDPAVYELALTKLGLPPGAAIAIEDSRSGVQAASSAGLDVIAVHLPPEMHNTVWGNASPTASFADLSQVKDFIARQILS